MQAADLMLFVLLALLALPAHGARLLMARAMEGPQEAADTHGPPEEGGGGNSSGPLSGWELGGFAKCAADKLNGMSHFKKADGDDLSKAALCEDWLPLFRDIADVPSNDIFCKLPLHVTPGEPALLSQIAGEGFAGSVRRMVCETPPEEPTEPRQLTEQELADFSACAAIKMAHAGDFERHDAEPLSKAGLCAAWEENFELVLDVPSNQLTCSMPPGTAGNAEVWQQITSKAVMDLIKGSVCVKGIYGETKKEVQPADDGKEGEAMEEGDLGPGPLSEWELGGFARCAADSMKGRGLFKRSDGEELSKAALCEDWLPLFRDIADVPSNDIFCKLPARLTPGDPALWAQVTGENFTGSVRRMVCEAPPANATEPRNLTEQELGELSACIAIKMAHQAGFERQDAEPLSKAGLCTAWEENFALVLDEPSNELICSLPPGTGGGNLEVWEQLTSKGVMDLVKESICVKGAHEDGAEKVQLDEGGDREEGDLGPGPLNEWELGGFARCAADNLKGKSVFEKGGGDELTKAALCADWSPLFRDIADVPSNDIFCKLPARLTPGDTALWAQVMGENFTASVRRMVCEAPPANATEPRNLTEQELGELSACIAIKMAHQGGFERQDAEPLSKAGLCAAWEENFALILDDPSNELICSLPPGTGGGNLEVWEQITSKWVMDIVKESVCVKGTHSEAEKAQVDDDEGEPEEDVQGMQSHQDGEQGRL